MARTKNPGLARVRPREDGDVDRLERGHASYRRRPRHDRVEPSIEPSAEPSTSVTVPEASVEVEQPDPPVPVDHQAEVDPQPEHAEAEQPEREPLELQTVPPFPGGPDDLSLLHDYAQHIAPWTWHSLLGTTHEAYVDRGDLTCATVGSKLEKMTCEGDSEAFDEVRTRVIASGLYPLVRASYTMTDKGLVSALVERWHSETSSFHMPFGEMTVTLDDVSALLHIPMDGRFYTHGLASRHEAAETCVMLLGGQSSDYTREFDAVNTLGLRFGFLQQRYTTTLAGLLY